jgi:hypothetical protein
VPKVGKLAPGIGTLSPWRKRFADQVFADGPGELVFARPFVSHVELFVGWPASPWPPVKRRRGSSDMQQRIAVALAGTCVLVAGCNATSNHAGPGTTTSTTAPPVARAALDGLLLSAAEINTAMGATRLSVADDTKQMDDVSALVARPECLQIYSPAEANAYANSGWIAVHRQFLSDPSDAHAAEQTVVLFPSAQQAAAFFTVSAQRWQACSNGSFAHAMTGGREVWDVGPTSNANGVLSTAARIRLEIYDHPTTQEGGGKTAQRVMTTRNNVVIDVLTDSPTPSDPAAVNIATQIATKVPSK